MASMYLLISFQLSRGKKKKYCFRLLFYYIKKLKTIIAADRMKMGSCFDGLISGLKWNFRECFFWRRAGAFYIYGTAAAAVATAKRNFLFLVDSSRNIQQTC